MKREIIPITSEEQWLELRKIDLTSTAISALFDLNPYCTAFEVYHAHKSDLHVPFQKTDRTEKGKRMEAYVAQEVAMTKGWKVTPINEYIRIPELKMGSSFDFEYEKPDGTKGILEIKGVDYFQHKEKWDDEAPAHIEIQVQHQLEVADRYEEACIVAATSIYDFHIYERNRDREFGANLKAAAKKFWADVAAGNEPKIDYYRDGDVISELYRNAAGDLIDKTGDDYLEGLCAKYERLKNEVSVAEKEKEATKFEIHRYLENAAGAFTNSFKCVTGWTKDSADKIITQEMVGTTIKGRKGYRQLLIKNTMESK